MSGEAYARHQQALRTHLTDPTLPASRLRMLADEHPERAAELLHNPNLDPRTFWRLAELDPDAAATAPLLRFWLAGNRLDLELAAAAPGAWPTLAVPDAPPALVDLLEPHASTHAHVLALLSRPDLNPATVERLKHWPHPDLPDLSPRQQFVWARDHVAATGNPPQRKIRTLGGVLKELLEHRTTYYQVAGAMDTLTVLLYRLALAGRLPYRTMADAMHGLPTYRTWRLLQMVILLALPDTPDADRRMAADLLNERPEDVPQAWWRFPAGRAPSAPRPAALLSWVGPRESDPLRAAFWAATGPWPQGVWSWLATWPDPRIRSLVAQNPHAPTWAIDTLREDASRYVRRLANDHPILRRYR